MKPGPKYKEGQKLICNQEQGPIFSAGWRPGLIFTVSEATYWTSSPPVASDWVYWPVEPGSDGSRSGVLESQVRPYPENKFHRALEAFTKYLEV